MKQIVVFGTGDFSDVVSFVLEKKLGQPIAAYTVYEKYRTSDKWHGRPCEAFETIEKQYAPDAFDIVLAMIGRQLFLERERIFYEIRTKGYRIPNVIDPSAQVDTGDIGDGNIILANASIEAHCRLGNGNIIWQNVAFPHHNVVGDFCNFAPSVSLSGYSRVGSHCFIGNNVCVKNRVVIDDYAFVGAGAYVTENVAKKQVVVPHRSYVLPEKTGFDFL